MNLYLAPFEGISGYVYRNAYYHYFGELDKYFIPFIMPNQFGHFSYKEKNDILPEHNEGMYAVPQILTNSAEDFLRTVESLKEYGYHEVNLNLGCPSRTVVTKGRGSGMLADPYKLDRFLKEVFESVDMKVSLKTRIGMEDPEEFEDLLAIYNNYPLEELVIHPRLQTDYYKNTPDWDVFAYAVRNCKCPLCYNGDIYSAEDYKRFTERFPDIDRVMLGRGILRNPGLAVLIRNGKSVDKITLRKFHDEIFEKYQKVLSGDKTILFKMKELWAFMALNFNDSQKCVKRIRKAEKLNVYEKAVDKLFEKLEIKN